jgi:integrase
VFRQAVLVLAALGLTEWATVRRAPDALAIALNYAVKLDLIRSNPAEARAVPKPKVPRREMIALTQSQCRRLLTAARPKPVYPLLALALGSGCRQGELLALRWEDVDLAAGSLRVRRSLARTRAGYVLKEPKSDAGRRTVTLPAFATDALRDHHARAARLKLTSAPVFCTRTGGPLDRKNVLRAFKAAVAAADAADPKPEDPIPTAVRFHDCRHTAASLLLSAGLSLRAVSRRLGHAKPEMTLRVYAHCLPADDERLAEELDRAMG